MALLGLGAFGCEAPQAPTSVVQVERECAAVGAPSFVRRDLLSDDDVAFEPSTGSVRFADFDGDGRLEIFVHEVDGGRITVLSGCEVGCIETRIEDGLRVPVRSHAVDLQRDGDVDLVVADIGALRPTDDLVGRVVILHNEGQGRLVPEVVLEDVGRVVCAEAGDLDGDGDLDLAVCEFGHEAVGSLRWLEQTPEGFMVHVLDAIPGAIQSFPVDMDGDGDLDLVAVFAQDAQAVKLYRNDGRGTFSVETLFDSNDGDYGMSSIEPSDLDQDGDVDLLVTNGDYLDTVRFEPQDTSPKAHGLGWLENLGTDFLWHDIVRMPASYTVRAADLDGDCDRDLLLGAMVRNDVLPVEFRESRIAWLENDGAQAFTLHSIVARGESLVSLDVHDIDGDGRKDFVFGAFGNVTGGARAALFRNVAQP